MAEFRDRIVELRRVPASTLRHNPENWRRHPEPQTKAMRAILEDVGFAGAVLARETDDGLELIDGHLRQEIAEDAEVPVLILDVNRDEARRLLLSLDPLAAMAETDPDALAALMKEAELGNDELEKFLAAQIPEAKQLGLTDPDEVPEPPEEPITQTGDLWVLGDHRVLCGDATDAGAGAELMDGRIADLVVTDPPYGVDVQERDMQQAEVRGRRKDGKGVTNDDLTGEGLATFLAQAFGAVVSSTRPGACWYVFAPAGVDYRLHLEALDEIGCGSSWTRVGEGSVRHGPRRLSLPA